MTLNLHRPPVTPAVRPLNRVRKFCLQFPCSSSPLHGWKLESSDAHLHMRVMPAVGWDFDHGCWPRKPKHVFSTWCLYFPTTWRPGPHASILRGPDGSCVTFYDLASEVTQCHSEYSRKPTWIRRRGPQIPHLSLRAVLELQPSWENTACWAWLTRPTAVRKSLGQSFDQFSLF